jgi:hypothetical protein
MALYRERKILPVSSESKKALKIWVIDAAPHPNHCNHSLLMVLQSFVVSYNNLCSGQAVSISLFKPKDG